MSSAVAGVLELVSITTDCKMLYVCVPVFGVIRFCHDTESKMFSPLFVIDCVSMAMFCVPAFRVRCVYMNEELFVPLVACKYISEPDAELMLPSILSCNTLKFAFALCKFTDPEDTAVMVAELIAPTLMVEFDPVTVMRDSPVI